MPGWNARAHPTRSCIPGIVNRIPGKASRTHRIGIRIHLRYGLYLDMAIIQDYGTGYSENNGKLDARVSGPGAPVGGSHCAPEGCMDWIDLETFVLAVQQGSLSEAARRLFVSQPAVSVRLRRLEAAVGEPLLHRSRKGVRPTAAGAHLFERARPLLESWRELGKELGSGAPLRGRLNLGCTDLVAVHHLPSVLRKVRRRHPELDVTVQVDGTAPLLAMLDSAEIELALATLPVPEDRYLSAAIFRDPLVVVCPPDHRLAGRKSVSPAAVASDSWILHKTSSLSRGLVDGFFSSLGMRLRIEMEISSPEAIRELVHAGLGLSVLPERTVKKDLAAGRMKKIVIHGFRIERSSGWVIRRDRPLSRAAREVQEIVEEHAPVAK